jgi:hypothetical protein
MIDACVPMTCEDLAANCDVVPDDGCGHPLDCGTCDAPAVCGGQGQANVCAIPEADRSCSGPWCWEAPSPLPFDAISLFAVSPSDVWAVGGGGVIMHFDGTRWSLAPSGTTQELDDIWMASATDGWIVGAGGTVLRWNGTQWAPKASGTTANLYGVSGDAANDVWIVGEGAARRWNGSAVVTPVASSVPQLLDVYVAPGAKVFAVGEGRVWAYSGTGWTAKTPDAPTFDSYVLDHITGTGTKAFAIGRSYSFGTGEELIYQWDGANAWTSLSHPGDPEWTDAFADGGHVYGVSDESIIDLEGFARTVGPGPTMVAASGAGGQVFIATNGGELWQGESGTYTTQSYGTRDKITAVAEIGGVPWFGTSGGDVLEWRGGLIVHHTQGAAITAIAGTSRDDVWAATVSSTYHFDGHSWSYVSSYGFTAAMHVKTGDVLLFGYHIWQQAENGFSEVTITGLPAMAWRASYDLGGDVYAVGVEDAGTTNAHVVKRVAGTWSELPQPGLADACGIAVAADDDLWIAGGDGTTGVVAHWNGSAWTKTAVAGTQRVCAIEVAGGEVFTASGGDVQHGGTTEHVLTSGGVNVLRSIGDSLWLGGDHGAVVRR